MQELILVSVVNTSNIAEARRHAVQLAAGISFSEADQGKVALIVTEMATNLIKHAPEGGQLLVQVRELNGVPGLEILALDQGPGIGNLTEALRDGYSTADSMGTGLGAIRRLATYFDAYSQPGGGTAVLAQISPTGTEATSASSGLLVGALCSSKPGQSISGDASVIQQWSDGITILLADGLGHGPQAAEAAQEAVRTFQAAPMLEPADSARAIHAALYHTRGAAIGVARLDLSRQEVRFAGVGNISGLIYSTARSHHMVSHNGTAGHSARKIQEFRYHWPDGGLLILHSDGLTNRWDLAQYPGLTGRHPSLVAGVLYRDWTRGHDDACVVVAREKETILREQTAP